MQHIADMSKYVMIHPVVGESEDDDQVIIATSIGAELDGFGITGMYYDTAHNVHRLLDLKYISSSEFSQTAESDPGQYTLSDGINNFITRHFPRTYS